MTLDFGPSSIRRAVRQQTGDWREALTPHHFYRLAGRAAPAFGLAALSLCGVAIGIVLGASVDVVAVARLAQIVLIHEPAAWVSLIVLASMAFWSAVWLRFRLRLSRLLLQALAPTGALFAFLALWAGSLWGKPVWHAWWLWDARLTAELVLLLLYAAIMGARVLFKPAHADAVAAQFALYGVVAVPLVYIAMHRATAGEGQGLVGLTGAPALHSTALAVVILMTLAFWMYAAAASLWRARSIILERERDAIGFDLQRDPP